MTANMTHERTTAENRNMTGVQIRSGIRAITESITTENGVACDYLIGALDELNRAKAEATQNPGDIS